MSLTNTLTALIIVTTLVILLTVATILLMVVMIVTRYRSYVACHMHSVWSAHVMVHFITLIIFDE